MGKQGIIKKQLQSSSTFMIREVEKCKVNNIV